MHVNNILIVQLLGGREAFFYRRASEKKNLSEIFLSQMLKCGPGAPKGCLQLHAPATPRAQSECIAHFARTFSIGTPRTTNPRGCFEGLLRAREIGFPISRDRIFYLICSTIEKWRAGPLLKSYGIFFPRKKHF